MADTRNSAPVGAGNTDTPTIEIANIIPFRPRPAKISYAPGVVPFDSSNPDHIHAWNTLFAMGWAEARYNEKKAAERAELEVVK